MKIPSNLQVILSMNIEYFEDLIYEYIKRQKMHINDTCIDNNRNA